ncbi:MAG: penicillin-binding protein 1C [Saprospiraceae bacterium]|nr:penicillin-binding protein 1C [Saprospiraceae bacterium]
MKRNNITRKLKLVISIFTCLLAIWYYFSLPVTLFSDPYSTVILDKSGHLLSARIAEDGQWRFPAGMQVPDRFEKSLLIFEDQYFYTHPGVNPFSVLRAFWQNIKSGEVVSGGSTISMQVIRLFRKNKARTVLEKVVECILATRLELRYSKEEILSLYTSHAPFGGNVVGIDAACWRYFGRDANSLSWAEAAMLAVLPNNPGLIHPGKNRQSLAAKRDRLLTRLLEKKLIDSLTLQLAVEEPLPEKPLPLPDKAPHLLDRVVKGGYGQQRMTTSIDLFWQEEVGRILDEHHRKLKENEIWNAAAVVMDLSSGEVVAYIGNARQAGAIHNHQVDIVDAPRSTGSILKPFLFAAMIDEGFILPGTLLPDIPTVINGFAPQNFSKQFAGVVPANAALVRSLNVPAVHMLRDYRYERFHLLLKEIGMQTLVYEPDHYGLSLILGGAEARLWDLAGMYGSLGRVLLRYKNSSGARRYNNEDYHAPLWMPGKDNDDNLRNSNVGLLSASSIWQTLETITELSRPDDESGWNNFYSAQKIAWKTGTSYGLRDAWAVGLTPDYVVAVWIGNATGEGRPGLIGGEVAAPLMFEIFSSLPSARGWFEAPLDEMVEAEVCGQSGYLAGPFCDEKTTQWISPAGRLSAICPYHQLLHLSLDELYQVNAYCESIDRIKNKNWFSLPPVQAHYFRMKNLQYLPVPPFRLDCGAVEADPAMEIIYPKAESQLFIPRQLDGQAGKVTFQLAHSHQERQVFWHLDETFLGETDRAHHMSIQANQGKHRLLLVDDKGLTLVHDFEVLSD